MNVGAIFGQVPFEWEPQDLGDFMGSRFRVTAFGKSVNRFASYEGNLHVGRNPESEWSSAVDEINGILEFAKFPLAAAIKTVFSPRLSADGMIAIGAAELIILD